MPLRRTLIVCFAALLALSGRSASLQAQARTIKLVVPIAPGGAVDLVARLLAEQIRQSRGMTVVIENRPGAGTAIGTEAVSRAAADGSTLLITAGGNLLISPHVRNVNYDPLVDFEPICTLVTIPDVIAVNSTSPYLSLANLIDAARAKPGEVTVGSLGPATDLQIAFEKLKRTANVDMTFVPYPGVAPAVTALLGSHITSAITSYASAKQQFKAGSLRALATLGRTRSEVLPDVPTVAESGYPDYDSQIWFGLFAPENTPKGTIAQLSSWFMAAVQAPEVKQKLVAQGLHPATTCGADFVALVHKDYDEFGRVVREANIRPQ